MQIALACVAASNNKISLSTGPYIYIKVMIIYAHLMFLYEEHVYHYLLWLSA